MLRRNHLLPSLSTLLLSVIPVLIILLSASLVTTSTSPPPSSTLYPRLSASIEEVRSWMDASNSTEQKTEFGPCNASPSGMTTWRQLSATEAPSLRMREGLVS
jgi:hypothetical protein